jgi:hypothetical protein
MSSRHGTTVEENITDIRPTLDQHIKEIRIRYRTFGKVNKQTDGLKFLLVWSTYFKTFSYLFEVMRIVQDHAIHFPGDKCALGESC